MLGFAKKSICRAAMLLTVSIVAQGSALTPAAQAADMECYADWSVAAPIVQQEKLMSVEELTAAASGHLKGEIVKTTLCKADGGYVYRLVVRGKDGQLKPMTVDAKVPFTD